MFGYVVVNKPELKIKDFDKYRSYYCGLCHTLNKGYGIFGRFTLNYDMAFLVMVLSDLYDEEQPTEIHKRRCIIHPLEKHEMRESDITKYAASMNIILSYYKVLDDFNDEHRFKSKLECWLLRGKAKRVMKEYPNKAEYIKSKLSMLSILESASDKDLDSVAKLFGEIMAEVFVYKPDFNEEMLSKMGFFLGKFIYLLDAFEDVEKDIKTGDYNPFREMYEALPREEFCDKILDLLMLVIGETTDAFERLPLVYNTEILRNILYSGVWTRFQLAKDRHLGITKDGKKKAKHTDKEKEN